SFNEEGGVIIQYDLRQNIYSDQQFAKDTIERLPEGEAGNETKVIVDGTYYSEEIAQKALEKNIEMIPTGLTGKKPSEDKMDYSEYKVDEARKNLLPGAQEIRVTTPSGKEFALDPSYSVVPSIDNHEVGVYTVQQVIQQGDEREVLESYFAVHVPTHSESDLRAGRVMSDMGQPADVRSDVSGLVKELWRYFAWAVLAVIMLEWWVYQRGY
ncbi:MAG: Ca-activated chloride channel, partial [Clostridiales bacterium]|nr:Ca-activated chloride channel [Clostridiales bacterium]